MIQHFTQHELELVYANAVNTIQFQNNFQDAVKELEQVAQAGHGKAAQRSFIKKRIYPDFRMWKLLCFPRPERVDDLTAP